MVHTLYDYTGEHEDELTFYGGDELTILRRGDNNEKEWWWAKDRKGVEGYVPCNLVGVSLNLKRFINNTQKSFYAKIKFKFIHIVQFLLSQLGSDHSRSNFSACIRKPPFFLLKTVIMIFLFEYLFYIF